jgi:hypothetical protein
LDYASICTVPEAKKPVIRLPPALPFALEEEDIESKLHSAAIATQAGDRIRVARAASRLRCV